MPRLYRKEDRLWLFDKGPVVDFSLFPPLLQRLGGREPIGRLQGIINTASEKTWVDLTLLNRLQLKPHDEDSLHTPTGPSLEVGRYQVGVELQFDDGVISRPFLDVVSADLRPHSYDALFGRDILEKAKFIYDGQAGVYELIMA